MAISCTTSEWPAHRYLGGLSRRRTWGGRVHTHLQHVSKLKERTLEHHNTLCEAHVVPNRTYNWTVHLWGIYLRRWLGIVFGICLVEEGKVRLDVVSSSLGSQCSINDHQLKNNHNFLHGISVGSSSARIGGVLMERFSIRTCKIPLWYKMNHFQFTNLRNESISFLHLPFANHGGLPIIALGFMHNCA